MDLAANYVRYLLFGHIRMPNLSQHGAPHMREAYVSMPLVDELLPVRLMPSTYRGVF